MIKLSACTEKYQNVSLGPPSRPGRAMVTSFTSRTAVITWPPAVTAADAPVIQYIVSVNLGHPKDRQLYRELYSPGNGTMKVVSSLSPYTVYTFDVAAENLAGRSPPGESSTPIRTKGEGGLFCSLYFFSFSF